MSSEAPTNSLSSVRWGLISVTPSSSTAASEAPDVSTTVSAPWRLASRTSAREKIIGHARRHAAAGGTTKCGFDDSDTSLSRQASHSARCRVEPGQDKAELVAAIGFVNGEIFAGLDVRWRHQAVDAFALDQPLQQLADRAADRIDRGHIAAQAMRHARHVDTAAAGVAFGRRAAQLQRRFDVIDIDENVDCRLIVSVTMSGTIEFRFAWNSGNA